MPTADGPRQIRPSASGSLVVLEASGHLRHFARMRNRPMPAPSNGLLWGGGFPRSSNTFTAIALKRCLTPGQSVEMHLHIPAQFLPLHKAGCPGIVLVRDPIDAVVSWCQFISGRGTIIEDLLEASLDYYLDFHAPLVRLADNLFICTFDLAARHPAAMLDAFFFHHGLLNVVPHLSNPQIFTEIDNLWMETHMGVNEMTVARPSVQRKACHQHYCEALARSPRLCEKLKRAQKVYLFFKARRRLPELA